MAFASHRDDDPFTGFRARSGDPGDELAAAPAQAECRNDGTRSSVVPSFQHFFYELYDFFGRSKDSIQSIRAQVNHSQLSRFDDGTDLVQRGDQAREVVLVVNRIRLDQSQRGTEADRLTHRHARLHPRAASEGGDLPHLSRGIGSQERGGTGRESVLTRLFTTEWEEGNPDAGGGITRKLGH